MTHDEVLATQVAEATDRLKAGLPTSPQEQRIADLEQARREDGARLDQLEFVVKALNTQMLKLALTASVALAKQGE